jgi:hypothetical protein
MYFQDDARGLAAEFVSGGDAIGGQRIEVTEGSRRVGLVDLRDAVELGSSGRD